MDSVNQFIVRITARIYDILHFVFTYCINTMLLMLKVNTVQIKHMPNAVQYIHKVKCEDKSNRNRRQQKKK